MNTTLKIFMVTGAVFEFHIVITTLPWDFNTQCIRWRADGYIGVNNIHIPYEHILVIAQGDAEIKTQGMMQ